MEEMERYRLNRYRRRMADRRDRDAKYRGLCVRFVVSAKIRQSVRKLPSMNQNLNRWKERLDPDSVQ